ncbi:Zn-ribbon domain-containing OB-fold protein [Halobaculum lipolyticum]|uniref:Zn-ribbon domain-containing OB-fold protein n=1 Tax=Halobaculum lipolyticum TaxID=3032001 RepID=A0ABD5W5Y7_9EURY|nr:OB-fold domain-containing protein [Halobaculum sp. DT31]
MGAYLSLPTWWRSLDSRYRLVIGECSACGGYTFPAEGACVECDAVDTLEPVEPAGTGEIVAHTVIEGGAPPEFSRLLDAAGAIGVAIVELDEGARVPGMLTDCDPHAPERGDTVERVVRRIYEQEGVVRYGTKFRPVE